MNYCFIKGFRHITTAGTGTKALELVEAASFDLIVLDVMLPDIDGFGLCQQLRRYTTVPILFLTARSGDYDKLMGLGIGGDGYITKPFSPMEVVARIRAQLRRKNLYSAPAAPKPQIMDFGVFAVDKTAAELTVHGVDTPCPAKEFELLVFLCEHPNQVFAALQLYEQVWGKALMGDEKTVVIHISRLRKRLEADSADPKYIVNLRGIGYKLYSGKTGILKRPYRLFKELFIQLHTLSGVLENSRQERRRLDEMRMEWVAGISHDLKTPLTYIKGYSSMMLSPQYDWTKEEIIKFLTEIEQKANHMQELIGDLNLSFRLDEQKTPLQREQTDLVEFVRRVVADVTNDPRAARYSLTLETAEPHIEAELDPRLLGRALHNLILNAVLHNPPDTSVKIRIKQNTRLEIVIADDGAGMSEENLRRLFDKYYRGTSTDILSEGTGLGMAIARQLVLAHAGDISVTSRLNEGTTVCVTLPMNS